MAVPIDDVIARGRWASPKSAKTYIQTGSALVFGERLPQAVRDICDRLARRPMALLEFFPPFDRERIGPSLLALTDHVDPCFRPLLEPLSFRRGMEEPHHPVLPIPLLFLWSCGIFSFRVLLQHAL